MANPSTKEVGRSTDAVLAATHRADVLDPSVREAVADQADQTDVAAAMHIDLADLEIALDEESKVR